MNESLPIAEILDRILSFPLVRLERGAITLATLLQLGLMIALVFAAEAILRRLILRPLFARTRLPAASQFAVTRIIGYAVIVLGVYQAVTLSGVDLGSLTFLAGTIGLGLGFGLQNVISNFISGLIILAERPIAVGDRVDVGETTGRVQRIGLRSTSLLTNDNISIIVPNSAFITERVINWSHEDPRVRVRIPFRVEFGTDTERLRAAMVDLAQNHPGVLTSPPPELLFVGFGDSSLDFELGIWSGEYHHRPLVFRSGLYYAIDARLRREGFRVPYPRSDLHLHPSRITVRPDGDGFVVESSASARTPGRSGPGRSPAVPGVDGRSE